MDWVVFIMNEKDRARLEYGPFPSEHHGCSVIQAELNELYSEVNAHASKTVCALEAIQVAAMALTFLEDCCEP